MTRFKSEFRISQKSIVWDTIVSNLTRAKLLYRIDEKSGQPRRLVRRIFDSSFQPVCITTRDRHTFYEFLNSSSRVAYAEKFALTHRVLCVT